MDIKTSALSVNMECEHNSFKAISSKVNDFVRKIWLFSATCIRMHSQQMQNAFSHSCLPSAEHVSYFDAQVLQIHTGTNTRALYQDCGVTFLNYCLVSCPQACFGPYWTLVKPQSKHFKISQRSCALQERVVRRNTELSMFKCHLVQSRRCSYACSFGKVWFVVNSKV